jgi:hypothetical protein
LSFYGFGIGFIFMAFAELCRWSANSYCGRKFHGVTPMKKYLALALLALALAGGVAAVSTINPRPALAGCSGASGC